MLNEIKLALRINHTYLDKDIESTIEIAKSELVRLGITKQIVDSTDKLIFNAVKTFCLMTYSDTKYIEVYQKSFDCQVDKLRKSETYLKNV